VVSFRSETDQGKLDGDGPARIRQARRQFTKYCDNCFVRQRILINWLCLK
jgi:hypothetical protein